MLETSKTGKMIVNANKPIVGTILANIILIIILLSMLIALLTLIASLAL